MRKEQLAKWRAAIAALPSGWQKWDGDDALYIAYPCFFCQHWEADNDDMSCTHPIEAVRNDYDWSEGPSDSVHCWGFTPFKFANGFLRIENLPRQWENTLGEWAQQEVERLEEEAS